MKTTLCLLPLLLVTLVAGCSSTEDAPVAGTPQQLAPTSPQRREAPDDEDLRPEPPARRPDLTRRVREAEREDTAPPAPATARAVDPRLRALQGDYLQAVRMLREPGGHPSREAARAQLKARIFASVQ